MKKILLAASEAVPFVKTGGLADVIGALPKYFDREKYDVRVVIPKYECMEQALPDGFEKILECETQLSWRRQDTGVWTGELEGITWYLIENSYYFSGPQPYGEIYLDAEKFAYFAKAVLTILPEVGFCPDVIHCNDWQTGLIPVFLKKQCPGEFYRRTRTVFTIHNLRFQGRWYIDAYKDITGLPDDCFGMDGLESYGRANPLKGGIVYADFVTTVSETYAKEIQESAGGEGLDGLLRASRNRLFGIVNGVDYALYDTGTDPALAFRYDTESFADGKKKNKGALQREMGLEESADAFLIGMVSRLTDQKGFDLVAARLDKIMLKSGIQVVLQGTGEARYEDFFRAFAGRYPGRAAVRIQYSEELAHRIYASADAFLMPSMFEPCGISQLISMHYGTVPMVRETGGLKDTVEPYVSGTGCGFTFFSYDADDMLDMVRRAQTLYRTNRAEWDAMALRGMKRDFSWEKSAAAYAALYERLGILCEEQLLEEERERKLREEELRRVLEASERQKARYTKTGSPKKKPARKKKNP